MNNTKPEDQKENETYSEDQWQKGADIKNIHKNKTNKQILSEAFPEWTEEEKTAIKKANEKHKKEGNDLKSIAKRNKKYKELYDANQRAIKELKETGHQTKETQIKYNNPKDDEIIKNKWKKLRKQYLTDNNLTEADAVKHITYNNTKEIHTDALHKIQGNLHMIYVKRANGYYTRETQREQTQRIDRINKRINELEKRAIIYKNKKTEIAWNQSEYRRLQLIIGRKKEQIKKIVESIINNKT